MRVATILDGTQQLGRVEGRRAADAAEETDLGRTGPSSPLAIALPLAVAAVAPLVVAPGVASGTRPGTIEEEGVASPPNDAERQGGPELDGERASDEDGQTADAEAGMEPDPVAVDGDGGGVPTGNRGGADEPSASGDAAVDGEKDAAARPARERARRRQRTGEDDQSPEGVDPYGKLGPMVRHVAAMTKELSEAQQTVGRLMAERDAMRRELAELKGLPVPEDDLDQPRPNREARLEAKAARQAERASIVPVEEIDPELAGRAEAVGRRRRMIALGVVGVLALTVLVLRMMGVGIPTESLSRNGLTGIAYVGPIFNILIGGFLIYRIFKFGGKGARWLFPDPEQEQRRKRRR